MEEIYEMLKSQGIFTGTFDEFKRTYESRSDKEFLHAALQKDKAYEGDIDSFLQFTGHRDDAITSDDLIDASFGEGKSFGDKLGAAISSTAVGIGEFFGVDQDILDSDKAKLAAFEAKSAKTEKMKTLQNVFNGATPRSRTFAEMKEDGFFSGKNSKKIKEETEEKISANVDDIGLIIVLAEDIWEFAKTDVKENFSLGGNKKQTIRVYNNFAFNLLKMQNKYIETKIADLTRIEKQVAKLEWAKGIRPLSAKEVKMLNELRNKIASTQEENSEEFLNYKKALLSFVAQVKEIEDFGINIFSSSIVSSIDESVLSILSQLSDNIIKLDRYDVKQKIELRYKSAVIRLKNEIESTSELNDGFGFKDHNLIKPSKITTSKSFFNKHFETIAKCSLGVETIAIDFRSAMNTKLSRFETKSSLAVISLVVLLYCFQSFSVNSDPNIYRSNHIHEKSKHTEIV